MPKSTLVWSMNAAYANHKWDGDVDPFVRVAEAMYASRWIGVQSGTGIGKTFFLAVLSYWFLEVWEDSVIVITGPKQEQLALHIWQEIARLFPKFGVGQLMSLKVRLSPDAPEDQGWEIVAFGAGVKAEEVGQSAKRAQGFHRGHMLIILEECPGIPQAVITAFENTCIAPHNIIVAVGNPDHEFDSLAAFIRNNAKRLTRVRISGFDHPNVVMKNPNFIPGAQSEVGLQMLLDRYRDPENGMYLSRARGISPKQAIDAVIHLPWLYEAAKRFEARPKAEMGRIDQKKIQGLPAFGVDAANSDKGDPACIGYGRDNVFIDADAFQCPDSNRLGVEVSERMRRLSVNANRVVVDGTGVGAGTVNALKERGHKVMDFSRPDTILNGRPLELKFEAVRGEVNKEGKIVLKKILQQQAEQFLNLRALGYWLAREDLRSGKVDVAQDEELFAELIAPTYTTREGKIVIEPKDEIIKRLGRSPNKADAFVMWNVARQVDTTLRRTSKLQFHGMTY